MKNNPDMCYLLVSLCERTKMEISDFEIENSTCEKHLEVHFNNRLTFDYHLSELCEKAREKIHLVNKCCYQKETS